MSAPSSSTSKIATAVILIPVLILAWFVAPWILPVWRWQNVDFEDLAKKSGIPESELRREFEMVVRYKPRYQKESDPIPWQIVNCKPPWHSVNPKNLNEDKPPLIVRCSLINDKDGEAISKLWVGQVPSERYFEIIGWRLPPGTFGKNPQRPVILFRGSSLKKMDLNAGLLKDSEVAGWENDDEWKDRNDGWQP
jgi:hypothetical protein